MANSLVIDARTMVKNPTDLVAIDGIGVALTGAVSGTNSDMRRFHHEE